MIFPLALQIYLDRAPSKAARDTLRALSKFRQAWQLHPWSSATATVLVAIPASFLYSHALNMLEANEITGPAMLVVLVAAAISSIAGFAFSAICGAMLLHVVKSPAVAVQIMLVCSIGIQSLSVWVLRRQVEWHTLPRLLLGGLIGLPAGLWLLLHLSRTYYAGALGGLLVLYGTWMLLRRAPTAWRAPRCTGTLAGLMGGITGGMAALPGPFVMIWCNLQGWSKARQRGLTQPFILIMQLLTLTALYALGSSTAPAVSVDPSAWAYLPSALAGTWIGLSVFRRLSDRQFATAINTLLIVSGVGLLL